MAMSGLAEQFLWAILTFEMALCLVVKNSIEHQQLGH